MQCCVDIFCLCFQSVQFSLHPINLFLTIASQDLLQNYQTKSVSSSSPVSRTSHFISCNNFVVQLQGCCSCRQISQKVQVWDLLTHTFHYTDPFKVSLGPLQSVWLNGGFFENLPTLMGKVLFVCTENFKDECFSNLCQCQEGFAERL